MFAQSLLDLGLSDSVLLIVRIIAAIGGAAVGWFLSDPLTRLTYRLSFKGPTPLVVLFLARTAGGLTLGLLIYFFMPLGGGGGGLGWGPGPGGSPGKGAGPGGDKGASLTTGKDGKSLSDPKTGKLSPPDSAPKLRTFIDIEILGGPNFKDDGKDRYYLIRKSDPAFSFSEAPLSLSELEAAFKEHHAKIQVRIHHTDYSTVIHTANDPTRRLQQLASKYEIPTQGPKDE